MTNCLILTVVHVGLIIADGGRSREQRDFLTYAWILNQPGNGDNAGSKVDMNAMGGSHR